MYCADLYVQALRLTRCHGRQLSHALVHVLQPCSIKRNRNLAIQYAIFLSFSLICWQWPLISATKRQKSLQFIWSATNAALTCGVMVNLTRCIKLLYFLSKALIILLMLPPTKKTAYSPFAVVCNFELTCLNSNSNQKIIKQFPTAAKGHGKGKTRHFLATHLSCTHRRV